MKKNLMALFAVMVLLTSPTFATDPTTPSQQIQNEFSRMFTHATAVQWEEVSNLNKVTFIHDGQFLTAFYSAQGAFESVSRNISTTMLPLLLQKELRGKLADFWISESFEVSNASGAHYYVTLENANEKVLIASNSTNWSVYKNASK